MNTCVPVLRNNKVVFQVGPHWVEKWCPTTRSRTKNDTQSIVLWGRDIGESAQHLLTGDLEPESLAVWTASSRVPADLRTSHVARRSLTWDGCPFLPHLWGGVPGPRPWVAKCPVFPTSGLTPCPEVLAPPRIDPVLRTRSHFIMVGNGRMENRLFFPLSPSFNFSLPSPPPPPLMFKFELY